MLKGKNRKYFINAVNSHIRKKLKTDAKLILNHDRLYLEFDDDKLVEIEEKLTKIPGIQSYSIIYQSPKNLEDAAKIAVKILKEKIKKEKNISFKIETKRSDKSFKYLSQDFTKEVAAIILKNNFSNLKVDVKNPDFILNFEIRTDFIYIYTIKIPLLGGFPATIAGSGLLMLSGGIDSPVAGFLAIKQGIEVELIHFESTPLTPIESINKVYKLANKLTDFLPNEKIKLHVVPFLKIHETILNNVSDSYIITIMRRMMYQIAEKFAEIKNINVLINGESVGQVASQTLSSIKVVENAVKLPILRPLITYDKQDIIAISKKIKTYDISIEPFSDCCTIYVPKNPVINPTVLKAEAEEKKLSYEPLIIDAVENIITIDVKKDEIIEFNIHGFEFQEAYKNWKKEKWLYHMKTKKLNI